VRVIVILSKNSFRFENKVGTIADVPAEEKTQNRATSSGIVTSKITRWFGGS
jgi:hypothetical protein